MEIRRAVIGDSAAVCDVLRRSIVELCAPDHRNDPEILQLWLANKTAEIVASWIERSGSGMLVVVEANAIPGVGSITDAGGITLN
jgi:hypothetical protein